MALPSTISPSLPLGTDGLGLGDDQIRALKLAVTDILGIPVDTAIAVALFTVVAGGLKSIAFQDANADPAVTGYLQRSGPRLKFHNGSSAVTIATTTDVSASAFGGNFTDLGGTIALAQIANDLITYAKLPNVSAISKLLGRGAAAGTGDIQEITLGGGLAMVGTTLSVSAPVPAAPEVATFALSIDTGQTTNSLTRLYVKSNTSSAIVVRTSVLGVSGGTGGKGGSPSSSNTVNTDSTITHSIGRIQNVTPSLAIASLANPFTGTLTVHYS